MNTEITIHPRLQHYGLSTSNIDAMIDWYQKVLGMSINHQSASEDNRAPWRSTTFLSNDEVNHRLVFFEIPELTVDDQRAKHPRVQHVAYAFSSLDDLLGTYVRLKNLGITPAAVTDQGIQVVFYYIDPDQNVVELNAGVYADEWTATEHIKTQKSTFVPVDPDKLVAARKSGVSEWETHTRALKGEFFPQGGFNPRALI